MIKKVDILGIQLDNYTVREAIMCVERYLSNNVLNTIESISLQMLIDSETNPVLKEVMSSPGSCNHWRERDYSGSGA